MDTGHVSFIIFGMLLEYASNITKRTLNHLIKKIIKGVIMILTETLKKKLREWLGLEETDEKLSKLENNLLSRLETIETELSTIKTEIKDLRKTKADEEELKSILQQMEKIEKELLFIRQLSMNLHPYKEFSTMEEIKEEILNIVSAGENVYLSELVSILRISWRKLYEALSQLEKEKKIEMRKEGNKVIVKLKKPSSRDTEYPLSSPHPPRP